VNSATKEVGYKTRGQWVAVLDGITYHSDDGFTWYDSGNVRVSTSLNQKLTPLYSDSLALPQDKVVLERPHQRRSKWNLDQRLEHLKRILEKHYDNPRKALAVHGERKRLLDFIEQSDDRFLKDYYRRLHGAVVFYADLKKILGVGRN